MDDMMRYNPGALGDYTSSLAGYSSRLESLGQEALQELHNAAEFFATEQGSDQHAQAQQLIIDAVQEGKDVITRHGGAVDTAATEYMAQDAAAGNSFTSI